MKKMTTTLSALTIAAALMMGLTACTNDDNIAAMTEQPEAVSQQTTVHVTVGAGIGDDATTRAAVTQEGTTRTLTFTEGDRLYITEGLYGGETTKYLVGYLNMVGSPSADGKSATFSGDLSVVLAGGTPSTYDFGDDDPLSVAVSKAWFVPADAPAGFILDNIYTIPVNDAKMIAADVNTLMKSALYVKGDYNSSTKSFSLSANKPILNCTIGNLKENTEYTVKLRFASNQSDYIMSTTRSSSSPWSAARRRPTYSDRKTSVQRCITCQGHTVHAASRSMCRKITAESCLMAVATQSPSKSETKSSTRRHQTE